MSTETITPYCYTPEQSEVLRLHDLYRRSLLDQKYYAYQLRRYQRWDWITNLVAAIATLLSITGLSFWKSSAGEFTSLAIGLAGALILVIRPIFKPSENIERYSRLHYGFTELFFEIENLVANIRSVGSMNDAHRDRIGVVIERFKNLAVQEDPSANLRQVEQFQEEVEKAIPASTLWLPQSG